MPEPGIASPLLQDHAVPEPGDVTTLGIDAMLQKFSGEFGIWQLRHFVLTSLAWALEAFHTMVMIFADREPGWRCTQLRSSSCGPTICASEPGSWEWIGGKGLSTVSEWGLVCSERYKVGLVQSGFFAGCLLGAGIFGHLSDSFLGRKGTLTTVCILNGIMGLLTAASPTYWGYLILRFLTGVGTGGVGLSAFVLATEPIGPGKRGVAGMSTFYFFSAGIAILSGIAYMFPSWRMLYIITSIPSLLFVLSIIPIIHESPRWYLVRGRPSDAMKIMREIADRNRNYLPPGISLSLDDSSSSNVDRNETEICSSDSASGNLIDVIRSPITRFRLFLMVIINFSCAVVYYGLNLNVVNLRTNIYLNVFLNSVVEMPAYTITALLLATVGRRYLTMMTMCFSGLSCFAGCLALSKGYYYMLARMISGVMGIFGVAATFNLLFIYTAELFPTVVRNAALGCATQAGQVGAILAPLVVVSGSGVAFVAFGTCATVGGLLAYYLPETLNQPLYDTMAGIESSVGGKV
ncbi:Organic cation/carnitine transporter 4 [Nymphaea thermarum]|nr:Organic cation/carnitine transporter 4 [Nymphaea thermarum]